MNNLVTITGGSCVGKNSVVGHLLSSSEICCREAISFTTREKRKDETDGVDYYFITTEKFEKLRSEDEILEFNYYDGNYYGTLKDEIKNRNGELLILVIDINGVKSIKEKLFENISTIFFIPPGNDINAQIKVLHQRLVNRKMNKRDSIKKRLQIARREIEQVNFFDRIIINDILEEAQKETLEYIKLTFPQCIKRTQTT